LAACDDSAGEKQIVENVKGRDRAKYLGGWEGNIGMHLREIWGVDSSGPAVNAVVNLRDP